MMSPAVVVTVACLCLPSAWADGYRRANAQLEREIEKLGREADPLRLDAMVRKYQAGLSVRVADMGGRSDVDLVEVRQRLQRRKTARLQIAMAVHEGRTSPEALVEYLRDLAEYQPSELGRLVFRNRMLGMRKRSLEIELKVLRTGRPPSRPER